MTIQKTIHTIGSASGIAAKEHECEDGPFVIQQSSFNTQLSQSGLTLAWEDMIYFPSPLKPNANVMDAVSQLCTKLAQITQPLAAAKKPFLILGGDHACAIGTWSGAAAALKPHGQLGLIWIDAHMDSHTPKTSESGNIHGMPLAALMGYGDPRLTHIAAPKAKLQPQSVALIGVRSFESGEAELLKRLNVRIFDRHEVESRGLDIVMQEAIAIVSNNTEGYGISIDIDAIDPAEAPGTGAPAPHGLSAQALCHALTQVAGDPRLMGAEIAEFDPHRDKDHKTEQIIFDLIKAIFFSRHCERSEAIHF